MQTFLIDPDFTKSAKVLDRQRLGKQRVETFQIVNVILGKIQGHKNHPAINQWRKNLGALILYGIEICKEWRSRGYKDTMLERFENFQKELSISDYSMPDWIKEENLFKSHRQALLYKNYDYYKQFGWNDEVKYDYWWPTKNGY